VYDKDEKVFVVMPAKKLRVNPNNELLELLNLNELNYSLK